MLNRVRTFRAAAFGTLLAGAVVSRGPAQTLAPVVLFEALPEDQAAKGELQPVALVPATDPRRAEAGRLLDNEAARFIQRLIATAWKRPGAPAGLLYPGAIQLVLKKGGNHAALGLSVPKD